MKFVALMPAVAAAAGLSRASMNVDLVSMKATLKGIAEESKNSGKYIEDDTKLVVQQMLDHINTTLVGLLADDQECAQDMIDTAFNAVEACSSARGAAFSGGIDGANTAQEGAAESFHLCKDASVPDALFLEREQSMMQTQGSPPAPTTQTGHDYGFNWTREWNTEGSSHALGNTSHETHARSDMHTKCTQLDSLVRTFASGGTNAVADQVQSDFCETPTDDFEDLYRTNRLMVTNSITWFSHMDDFEANNAADYKEKRRQCHEARHRQQIRVHECNRLQTAFEGAFCAYANAIDETCHLYDTCYDATHATWTTDKGTIEDAETQFKAQQHSLEHILCYGAQILADSTDLAACDSLACAGCDALTIRYDEPHSEISCSEEQGVFRPCDDSFLASYYSSYFGTETPVDECNACSDPVLIAWGA